MLVFIMCAASYQNEVGMYYQHQEMQKVLDIVIYSQNAKRTITIQVKARLSKNFVKFIFPSPVGGTGDGNEEMAKI